LAYLHSRVATVTVVVYSSYKDLLSFKVKRCSLCIG